MLRVALALLFAFAGAATIARADSASTSSPTASPVPAERADVDDDASLISPVRTYTVQGTYTGATYGPGNLIVSQVIQRIAAFYVGKSLVRVTLPRLQTINAVDGGYGDMQVFYLVERGALHHGWYSGVFAQFPTGTPDILSTRKWLLGPAFAYLFTAKPRTRLIGVLLQTAFSVAGPRSVPGQSAVSFLPFATVYLKNGWFLKTPESPWLFDLERGQTLIALGAGLGKEARVGPMPCLISATDEETIIHANLFNAPKNTIRLTFTFVIASK